ncbi:MAG: shikimate dehydrogenase [Acidobacteriota bacterium]|nr:shikimate dehydrogenase [Acidobacteriota bacterium]
MAQKRKFPKICIALGFPDIEKLFKNARYEAEAGETFLEFRLDYLPDPERGAAAIRKFLDQFPHCLILATCRRHQNHGNFKGAIDEQLRILDLAIQNGACAVDIEIETAELVGEKLNAYRLHSQLIVSYHNFENTPQLESILRRVTRIPADAYKVVTTARKPSDTGRVIEAGRNNPRVPLIALAMGEMGFASRVLGSVFGGIFTYAAPISAQGTAPGTAPGQVCAKQLRHLYRIEKFSKNAKVYGVIADPVRHSISPAVHNRALQYRRLDAVYLPFLVPPPQLRDFFTLSEKLPVCGFSVTIPHKEKVMKYLDTIDPLARRIGAVNTVWRKAGKWRGTNTDVAGVLQPLAKQLRLPNSSVLIAGSGGAARGAACALADAGAKVSLVGRNSERVRALARACGGTALSQEQANAGKFDVLVHATPLGMFPNVDQCFFKDSIPADIVFDMVYNPSDTLLLRRAREQGKTVVPGLRMFIEQAVAQFEIWTGESAPRAAMQKAAEQALA